MDKQPNEGSYQTPFVKFLQGCMQLERGQLLFSSGKGTLDEPYSFVPAMINPIEVGYILFALSNNDPDNPRRIYAEINSSVFVFDPREDIPVSIERPVIRWTATEQIGAKVLQRRILERIRPGLGDLVPE